MAKLVTRPNCFGSFAVYECMCEECLSTSDCEKKFEEIEEEYRYWHHIP